MKNLALFLALLAGSASVSADQWVNGYVRSDGSYVAPHFRSSPDSHQWNNYSTQGNVNPYTGNKGYVAPQYVPAPTYRAPQYQTPYNPYMGNVGPDGYAR